MYDASSRERRDLGSVIASSAPRDADVPVAAPSGKDDDHSMKQSRLEIRHSPSLRSRSSR